MMGKKLLFAIGLLLALATLVGCGHHHLWKEATCTYPKYCTECNETEGQALGHDWTEATCTQPKVCRRCGAVEGDALGHDWIEATCSHPKKCRRCGATEGEALQHEWVFKEIVEPTCKNRGYSLFVCNLCGHEESRDYVSALGHDMTEATCTEPKTCTRCGYTQGKPLGHDASTITCTEGGICSRCGETIAPLGHDWVDATCTKPKTCTRCGITEGDALGHTTNNGTCARCGKEIKEPIVFSGTGNTVISDIEVPRDVYKVTMKHNGSRNFFVIPYNKDGDRISSLAVESGRYEGSVFFAEDINHGFLEITAGGEWSISFEQIPSGGTSNIAGHGDWVSPWFELKSGALVVSMTNDGDRNFFVIVYDEKGKRYSSLVIETGPYSGQTVFNQGTAGMKYCIEVTSSGNWTVDFGLGDPVTKQ